MKTPNALQLIAVCAGITTAGVAFAHDGHGLIGSHWHATDVWGFALVGALAVLGAWFSGRGK
jgi:hypothetical protein